MAALSSERRQQSPANLGVGHDREDSGHPAVNLTEHRNQPLDPRDRMLIADPQQHNTYCCDTLAHDQIAEIEVVRKNDAVICASPGQDISVRYPGTDLTHQPDVIAPFAEHLGEIDLNTLIDKPLYRSDAAATLPSIS